MLASHQAPNHLLKWFKLASSDFKPRPHYSHPSLRPVTVWSSEVEIPFSTRITTHRSRCTNYTSSTTSSTTPTCCFLRQVNSHSGCCCPRSAHSLVVTASIPFIEKCFPETHRCLEWEIQRKSIYFLIFPALYLHESSKSTDCPFLLDFFSFLFCCC